MITFLASPKSFTGYTGRIQRNAILSWKAVHPDAEVILYGDSQGAADVCRQLGLRHIPDITCSPSGVPYFNSIVDHAALNGRYDIQCYLNCDIILAGDIIPAVTQVSFERYLITGQRIDMPEGLEIDAADNAWRDNLQQILQSGKLKLHAPTGMDYFIFKRGMWKSLLPLVIGRGGYDDALVLYCLRNKIPFINGTLSILAFHQFHDYGHVSGGNKTVAQGLDARNNMLLHRNHHSRPNSADAFWLLDKGDLIVNQRQRDVLRKMEHYTRFHLGLEKISLLFRILWRLAVGMGLVKPKLITLQDIIQQTTKQ